jgi:hypothetical protein
VPHQGRLIESVKPQVGKPGQIGAERKNKIAECWPMQLLRFAQGKLCGSKE